MEAEQIALVFATAGDPPNLKWDVRQEEIGAPTDWRDSNLKGLTWISITPWKFSIPKMMGRLEKVYIYNSGKKMLAIFGIYVS